jgi:hypothetical protein
MTLYDEIAAGLVDSQLESIERTDDSIEFLVRPPTVRGYWQAMLVAGIAADVDPDGPELYGVTLVLPDGSAQWDSRARIHLHIRGAIETADEDEIAAALVGELTFHRPHGRLAVERGVTLDDPAEARRGAPPEARLQGEGSYTEWSDRHGRLIRQSGYSARMMAGAGTWGMDYAHLAPQRGIDG